VHALFRSFNLEPSLLLVMKRFSHSFLRNIIQHRTVENQSSKPVPDALGLLTNNSDGPLTAYQLCPLLNTLDGLSLISVSDSDQCSEALVVSHATQRPVNSAVLTGLQNAQSLVDLTFTVLISKPISLTDGLIRPPQVPYPDWHYQPCPLLHIKFPNNILSDFQRGTCR
jgi:hypothetical protein